jgi:hypothetical protein
VLFDTVVDELGLELFVTRGFPSLSYLQDAAEYIEADGRPTHIYVMTDLDPSGISINENIQARLEEFAPYSEIHVHRLAVTPEQVVEMNLPSRPNKKTDTRTAGFEAEYGHLSVELDAIPPDTLRQMVRDAVEAHMDPWKLETLKLAELEERDGLRNLFGS